MGTRTVEAELSVEQLQQLLDNAKKGGGKATLAVTYETSSTNRELQAIMNGLVNLSSFTPSRVEALATDILGELDAIPVSNVKLVKTAKKPTGQIYSAWKTAEGKPTLDDVLNGVGNYCQQMAAVLRAKRTKGWETKVQRLLGLAKVITPEVSQPAKAEDVPPAPLVEASPEEEAELEKANDSDVEV